MPSTEAIENGVHRGITNGITNGINPGAASLDKDELRERTLEMLTRLCKISGGCSLGRLAEIVGVDQDQVQKALLWLKKEGLVSTKDPKGPTGELRWLVTDKAKDLAPKEEPGLISKSYISKSDISKSYTDDEEEDDEGNDDDQSREDDSSPGATVGESPPAGEVFPCGKCSRILSSQEELDDHLEKQHVDDFPEGDFKARCGAMLPTAIVWNESQICLMTKDRNSFVIFKPELDPMAASFFKKEGTKERGGNIFFNIPGTNVWEGEYESLVFKKTNLFKFFKEHKTNLPPDVIAAIKNMNYSETKKTNEEMLEIDSDDKRTVTEERTSTNIPKQFTVTMQLTKDISADLHFEARVANVVDRRGNERDEKGIELRCLNARQVQRNMMEDYLAQLPDGIPRYYGILALGEPKEGRGY